MKQKIQNYQNLATTQERKDILSIVEAAYYAIDTDDALRQSVIIDGDTLTVKGTSYDLTQYQDIYVIGFGKVASQAGATLESILGERLKRGAVVGIKNANTTKVQTFVGTHPLPSESNLEAARAIEGVAHEAGENDLVLVIVGGGGSSLLCSSESELTQGKKLYEEFLNTGGNIEEMNTIRKHISTFKGGGLAELIYPATVINLVFSDVPGDDVEAIASGPTMFDTSTKDDAQAILNQYKMSGYELNETPKNQMFFEKVSNFMIVSNKTALEAMAQQVKNLNYEVVVAGDDLFLTAPETITKLQSLAKPGTIVIAGGETRFVIPENCTGKGGRSDMLSLEMMGSLKDGQVFVAFASDGHDNTEAAGGIVDNHTRALVPNLDLDVEDRMYCLDSFPVMEALNALIFTGLIESNISDLMILLTPHQ